MISITNRGIKRRKNKKGAEWAVFKIISFILVAIFLALVIYGVTSGQLSPLFKKAGMFMDAVSSQLGIKKATTIDNSKNVNLPPPYGGGKLIFDLSKMQCELLLNDGQRYRFDYSTGNIESYEKIIFLEDPLAFTDYFSTSLRYFRGQWYFSRGSSQEWRLIDYSNDNIVVNFLDRIITDNILSSYIKNQLPGKNMQQATTFFSSNPHAVIKEDWIGGVFVGSSSVQVPTNYLLNLKTNLQRECK